MVSPSNHRLARQAPSLFWVGLAESSNDSESILARAKEVPSEGRGGLSGLPERGHCNRLQSRLRDGAAVAPERSASEAADVGMRRFG